MTVLLLGPDYRCKGGIATVLRNYLEYPNKEGIDFKFLKVRGDGSKLMKLLQSVFGLFKMFWILMTSKIDIIHAHPSEYNGFYRYIPYMMMGKIFRKKVIFHIHGGTFDTFYHEQIRVIRDFIKWTLIKCDIVICLTETWAELFHKIGVKRVEVIRNSISQPDSNPYNPYSTSLTYMGYIEQRKGVFDLIEAFKLCDRAENIVLNICGTGDDEELSKLIKINGLKDRVICHGWVNSEQKDRIYRSTAIFILPSYFEALPMVLLEAMAYGIPVISTPVGGIPELIEDGVDGLLIQPGDTGTLTKTINRLLSDKDLCLKMSNAAYQKIKQGYTMKVSFQALHRIYAKLMQI